MKKDELDILFKKLEGSFDVQQTPKGHQKRFLEKLNGEKQTEKKPWNIWKPLSIAASVAVLFTIGFLFLKNDGHQNDLASVSPEMEQTQSFFTNEIKKELQTLKAFDNPETMAVVNDALKQIAQLESEYENLKKDLGESGNDKRVIYAMITNFQNRIDLLKQVINKMEKIETLKTNTHETIL